MLVEIRPYTSLTNMEPLLSVLHWPWGHTSALHSGLWMRECGRNHLASGCLGGVCIGRVSWYSLSFPNMAFWTCLPFSFVPSSLDVVVSVIMAYWLSFYNHGIIQASASRVWLDKHQPSEMCFCQRRYSFFQGLGPGITSLTKENIVSGKHTGLGVKRHVCLYQSKPAGLPAGPGAETLRRGPQIQSMARELGPLCCI